MKPNIIVFPGSNCDRDIFVAIKKTTGHVSKMIWHKDTSLDNPNLIVLPGGFSHGDYLRSGSIASRAPIMREVIAKALNGTPVCLLYTSPSPRDKRQSRMPSSA